MTILRKACCDICDKEEYEKIPNSGWNGWVMIQGVVLNGVENPMFCVSCRNVIMNFIDNLEIKK